MMKSLFFNWNNSCILGRPAGRRSDVQVDIPQRFLDACGSTARASATRIVSRRHILASDGAEILVAYRQQVWERGGLSKDVWSMEDSLMSFPYLCKQKGWNAGGCLPTCCRWRRYSPWIGPWSLVKGEFTQWNLYSWTIIQKKKKTEKRCRNSIPLLGFGDLLSGSNRQ